VVLLGKPGKALTLVFFLEEVVSILKASVETQHDRKITLTTAFIALKLRKEEKYCIPLNNS
jgi:hypothetical protein